MRLWFSVLYKMALALLLVVAVLIQAVHGLQIPGYDDGNYFSYFTVMANFIAAGALVVSAYMSARRKQSRFVDYLRGASVVYMALTGLGYTVAVVGRHLTLLPWIMILIPWANDVIHFAGPLLVVADWLANPPAKPLRLQRTLYWLAFPAGYVLFALVRGSLTGWYPYPFLDPGTYGYGSTILACAALAGLVIALSVVIIRLPRMRRRPVV